MTDRTRIRIGRAMAATAVVAAVAGCLWIVALGRSGVLVTDTVVQHAMIAVGFGAMVWMVLPSQPRNRVVWISALAAVSTGLVVLSAAVVHQALSATGGPGSILDAVPADLPVSAALAGMVYHSLWFGMLLVLTLVVLHLPDGELPSPRWRWVARAVWVLTAIGVVSFAAAVPPSATATYIELQERAASLQPFAIGALGFPGVGLLIPVCVAGVIVRYRRSDGVQRQQLRWVAFGASVVTPILLVGVYFEAVGPGEVPTGWLLLLGLVILIGSFAVSIGRYRLYDIDVVISKTLVYGALAGLIGVLYVGIVVGLGSLSGLYGVGQGPDAVLGVAALVVIPLVFQPARRWSERWANRVVYGRRATPYEVLSTFSQTVAAADPEVLVQVARSLTEGTTAEGTEIWVTGGGEPRRVAAWPDGPTDTPAGSPWRVPIAHDDEELGWVVVRPAPGQPLLPTDERLVAQVASGLGLALRNQALTADLRDRVDQLRESRRRIVAVQDRTRRRLERDLHDGAQQRLVALKIKLGLATAMAHKEGLGAVERSVADLAAQADGVIEAVRDFARGVYPPLLEAEGLQAALTAAARRASVPVSVQAAGVGRLSREVEATVYFCVRAGVASAAERGAGSVQVVVDEDAGGVGFEVRDDGRAVDGAGGALVTVEDRLDAVGGTLQVTSRPGHGTLLVGRIPIVATVGA